MKAYIRLVIMMFLAFALGVLSVPADDLNNNEVEFTGVISSVLQNGEGIGTLFLHLQDFDLRVVVTSETSVRDKDNDEITMADLKVNDQVSIIGKYSSSGILATSIRVTANASTDFESEGTSPELKSRERISLSASWASTLLLPLTRRSRLKA